VLDSPELGGLLFIDHDMVFESAEAIRCIESAIESDATVGAAYSMRRPGKIIGGVDGTKLPPDKGEGQQWARKPGNLYSTPRWITLDARQRMVPSVALENEIAPIAPPQDTKWIKHVTIRSERLSKFWGRDMYIGANVLLPAGFDEHQSARYPLVVYHGHFPYTFEGFRETPPDPNLKPDFSARFNLAGYNRIQQELNHQFYKDWTAANFPRVLLMEVRHATPYYDDSYAVNSASQGPWGDAIMYELIPEVEKRFRGLGQGWARITYGGSTGGWEALAVQMFYPDDFNGAFAASFPEPSAVVALGSLTPGATYTFKLTANETGFKVRIAVTAKNTYGETTAYSDESAPVS
jgi:hypothetical protein